MPASHHSAPLRLPVLRSSSFRIIAMFAGCFLFTGITVTAFSGYHSQRLLSQQTKRIVANERDEALSEAQGQDVIHLQSTVKELVLNEPGFYYLLQNAQEQVVVGNMFHLRPIAGWRWLSWTHRTHPPDHHPVIGYGTALNDGGYFFVGIDATPLQSLRHDLWLTLAWSALMFLLIGLGGGFLLSRLVLGRIEVISQTARKIMRGDISQRLALNETGDEFDHLAHSLNAMLDRNETLIASVRQISDDIAHDMRRPLARLGQNLDKAQTATTHDIQNTAITQAQNNLQDALEIFSSLLRLAQLEAGDRIPDRQTLIVADLFNTLADLYQPVVQEQEQTLTILSPAQNLTLDGNRILLTQTLSNLIENAINHSPSGTVITLSAHMQNNRIIITVSDNGPGIPAEDHERVFEKMVRLDTSRTVPGTGLGLSMVRAIVNLHRGSIRLVDNHPGLRCEIVFPTS
ncbi:MULTISPECIES: sensor histidine kinase [Gluconobacter]|uniref:histidine kinase n=1 Tax=Gluconobacter cadivus TaxID=2728101 RepID=A0ABR9YTZ1_9PROT|nr:MULTISPECIES: HAMP domain-containing sensor histidine kinase [Gluconobacter]MBF0887840.1 HAMP domain-containing histidine kinase [Gluconobacter cadivus]MBS1058999.1 HAMP domain-containing histidine kinase [Gluconobacter sp. Dm-44]